MAKHIDKALSIQVHLNGLSFCILNQTSQTVEFLKALHFEKQHTPNEVLNLLKAELSTNTVFSDHFNAVNVIHQNNLATLVPETLYDPNHKVDYLKFNAKILKTDFITEDHITANNTVNIYVPYVNINNYIFDSFGEFTYKHSSTVLIENALRIETKPVAANVFLNVNTTTFEITVLKNKKLALYNVFDYSTKEDFIYYVLNIFEQLQLDTENTELVLSGQIELEDSLYQMLYTYIRHITFVKPNFKLADSIDAQTLHKFNLILNSF